MLKRGALFLGLGLLGAGVACTPNAEPRNLTLLKEEIVRYVDSGRYQQEIAAVATAAEKWLEERAPGGGGRLTVVFDLDETMLSNLPQMRSEDFGYRPTAWAAWVARGEAPVIEPVRAVYRRARQLGIEVVFLSGRREKDRPGTEKNLKFADVSDYALLMLKSDDSNETSASFKTAARQRLTAEGRVIVANIGDQESDLVGGFAERTFKLPSPFYLLP